MPLRWILGNAVVDENTFLPGKEIFLEAYAPNPAPDQLQVFQKYSSAMRQLLSHVGVPDQRSVSSFVVTALDPPIYRGDRPWALPQPRGMRKSATFVFAPNNSQEVSGRIYCSRTGKAHLTLGGGVNATDPTGTIPIGMDGKAELKADLHFARDPVMEVEVLTGQSLATHMIDTLAYDFASAEDVERTDVTARIDLQLDELQERLPMAYEPPSDWSMTPVESVIEGGAGEVVSTYVRINAPSPGHGYFAVSFVDIQDRNLGETTDAWIITVDEDLNVSAITQPSEMPLRIPQFAY